MNLEEKILIEYVIDEVPHLSSKDTAKVKRMLDKIKRAEALKQHIQSLPQAQKAAVEKAQSFGWEVIGAELPAGIVTLYSKGKKMQINQLGKRI